MIPERSAGLLLPLFSLRSPDDFGRGEIGGLAAAGDLALAMGQRLILLLPIDELPPGESSPYSPCSVLAIDPLYVSLPQVPWIDRAAVAAAHGEVAKSPGDLLLLRSVKEKLLDAAFARFQRESGPARDRYFRFTESNREWLDDYALFHLFRRKFDSAEWSKWPEGLARHDAAAIAEATRGQAAAIERFKFAQFIANDQWMQARAAINRRGVFLGGDLAFSPSRTSVEVWAHQQLFDLTRAVGAPPDAFSATGQRWGLPMPAWDRMRAEGYSFIRARIRRARALYDFIRIDHLVGLFRTYGFPETEDSSGAFDPPEEATQQAQGEEILRAIRMEAGSLEIIAEDLGVVPPFIRATLLRLGIPGYKVARWEREWDTPAQPYIRPADYPAVSLATTGTHDTETLAEWWESIDEAERRSFLEVMDIPSSAPTPKLDEATLDGIIAALYRSPSRLAVLPIQDLFGWKARINVPGTVDAGNWRWRLPFYPAHAEDDRKIRARIERIRAIAEKTGRFKTGAF